MKLKLLYALIFCLVYTNINSQSLGNGMPFDGGGGLTRERIQMVYWRAELMAIGFSAGSTMDTLFFNITSRNSMQPYSLSIDYFYTAPNFCYGGTWSLAPLVIAGGTVFSDSVDMSVAGNFYVPPSGGVLKIPLSTPIVWSGIANSLVIEMCWETNSGQPTDSTQIMSQSCYTVSRVRSNQSNIGACSMYPTMPGVFFDFSAARPDLFRLAQPTPANFPNTKNNATEIKNIFYEGNSLSVKYFSTDNSKFNLKIIDIAGRIIFEEKNLKSVNGENVVNINTALIKGVYTVLLQSENGKTGKVFCN